MNKILFISNVRPLSNSKEGKSGFTWTIYQYLLSKKYEVELLVMPNNKGIIYNQLDLFALIRKKIRVKWDMYNKIFVYPDTLLTSLPEFVLNKTIVLAPDATSMARWSKYKAYKNDNAVSYIKILYQYLLAKRFMCFEDRYINRINKYIVVGMKDRSWLRRKSTKKYWENIQYLPHPLVSNAIVEFKNINLMVYQNKRFIFSGDMSYSYVGKNISLLSNELDKLSNDEKIDILVVGGNNKWVADLLSNASGVNVKYIEWIDDYTQICQIGRDVHCVPLIAGAGTKNRVLTALANGLEVISTPKGTENINLNGITHVIVKKQMNSFAKAMIKSAKNKYSIAEISQLLNERKMFRKRVQQDFINVMDKILL